MMEFKNEVDRWHKIKEFAEYVRRYAEFQEIDAIGNCSWYEWDNQAMEDYCWNDNVRKHPFKTKALDNQSQEICSKCPYYDPRPLGETTNE